MKRPTYYHPCPKCGANLDPGERCDCESQVQPQAQTTDSNTQETAA